MIEAGLDGSKEFGRRAHVLVHGAAEEGKGPIFLGSFACG